MFRTLSFATALAGLATAPLAAFEMNAMTDAERTTFRAEIRAYLMENPEVLLEAINVLEQRQATDAARGDGELIGTNADDIFDDGYSWVGGNPDGDITVVEFMDYRCGFCKKAFPEVIELLSTDGNIRFIVKEFPILGEQSVLASRFAIAVKAVEGDKAYGETHDSLMTMRADVTEQGLKDLSQKFGYDTKAVFTEMNSETTSKIINQNRALAQRLNINGTPSFVFNDQMLRGYIPLGDMQQVVSELRGE